MSKNTTQPTNPNVFKFDDADLNKMMTEGTAAGEVVGLEEGEGTRGILTGPGPLIDRSNDASGDPQEPLKTWEFRHDNGSASWVLSSHQLEKALPDLTGQDVAIMRLPTISKGGKRINQFKVVSFGTPKASKKAS